MFRNIPQVTRNLITINIIVLILTSIDRTGRLTAYFALFSPASPHFKIWQILTYMFMHGGFWHLFFNMYTLAIFGSPLENAWGPRKFFRFYIFCGIGAALCNMLVMWLEGNGAPTVGASGAIYGVLMGYAMLYPDSRLTLLFPPVTLTAKWFVIIFAGIELACGIFGTADGVAHFAHLGGLVTALAILFIWKAQHKLYQWE